VIVFVVVRVLCLTCPRRNAAIVLLHDLGHDPAEVMSTLPALEARGGHIQPARLTGAPAGCRPDRVTAPGTHRPVSPGVQPSRGRQPGSRITARDKWRGKASAISSLPLWTATESLPACLWSRPIGTICAWLCSRQARWLLAGSGSGCRRFWPRAGGPARRSRP